MGGKSQGYQSPPQITGAAAPDNTMAMMTMMNEMMNSTMGMLAQGLMMQPDINIPAFPDIPVPQILSMPLMDWDMEFLKAETEAMNEEYLAGVGRKGVTDTILTSPLLEEEAAQTTQSLLGGANASA